MREILFKAKRTDNGEWVEGFYFCMVHDDGRHIHHFIMPIGCDLSLGTPIDKIQVEIDIDTLCQYTGLTDKNGCKIWEGDIVRDNVVFGPVVWDEKYVQFMIDDECDGHQDYSDWWQEVEVIGNRFDNPQLLHD